MESLAGWVFADMLLVLFLVGIGTAIPQAPPPPPPPPKADKPPKPDKPPEIIGMNTTPIKQQIRVDAAGLTAGDRSAARATCAALKRAFEPQIEHQDRAAFVLLFGGGGDPSEAARVAEKIYPQLRCASRTVFPVGTVRRTYWDGNMGPNDARAEVFLYTAKKPG